MNAGSQEVEGIRNTLKIIEENDLFARDARLHRVRRQDPEAATEAVIEEEDEEEEDQDEARGWKNGGKKNKNKNKKTKKPEEMVVPESIPEPPPAAPEEVKETSGAQANSIAMEETMVKTVVERDPFTSGIQFSAYGGEARPTYKPARATRPPPMLAVSGSGPESRFMYGLDRNGNPQYMDEAAVSMLLQNPQAKKVQ